MKRQVLFLLASIASVSCKSMQSGSTALTVTEPTASAASKEVSDWFGTFVAKGPISPEIETYLGREQRIGTGEDQIDQAN